jgi:hypothetical protein
MKNFVTVRECFKCLENQNPLSGHVWIEHGETTHYRVIGAVGLHSTYKTLVAAQKEAKALQDFYNKFSL